MAEPQKLPPEGAPSPVPGGIAARAQARAATPYLTDLNPEQREAVETLDGPVLVLAGAGTGKTRVLTTRIAHILATGRARPAEILAVTFTNKAAREMKERVGQMVGQVVEGMPWLGTFHAIGVKILRRHAELVDLKSDFTILDTDDQIRLMKQLIEAENIDEKRWPARALAGLIDHWKNRGLIPAQVPHGEAASFANGRGAKLYKAYQERLKTLNAADFGDLLLENIRLFREQPDVLRQYQQRFKFTLVDEYQDTNVAQYLWLRLLGQRSLPSPLAGEGGARSAPGEGVASQDSPASRLRRSAPLSRKGRGVVRRKTSAASATTTSRSMAGVAPRSTTSCASRRIFPARRSSGWSAITARPATSSPPPRISSPTMRAGSARRCAPRTCRAKRFPSPALGIPRRRRAQSARRSSSCSAPATSSTRSPFWCAPRSRCASSRTASSRSASRIG
jgi:DNA helicase-2/ATP-dependent DNA helicase PcrA